MSDESFGVLLLGYNRPEFTINRLHELGNNRELNVYVSIDGGADESVVKKFQKLQNYYSLKNCQSIKFVIHQKNMGLVRHLVSTITYILEEVENLIILEDDILISDTYVDNIISVAKESFKNENIATVGGFSPLTNRRFFPKTNRWRETKYFSAWGWCVNRKIWQLYNHVLDASKIEEDLSGSTIWHKLTPYQKRVWSSRFQKVAKNPYLTWDYQMQYLTFKFELTHVLPTFRISDNEGFYDERSTNTKLERPSWMGSSTYTFSSLFEGKVSKPSNSLLQFIDSLTIGGDRHILKLRILASKILKLKSPRQAQIGKLTR